MKSASSLRLSTATALLCWLATSLFGQNPNASTTATPPVSDLVAPDFVATPLKEWERKFTVFQFKTFEKEGHVLPYRFYEPSPLKAGTAYPLVVFFHGAGERGMDNRLQFLRFATVTTFWEKHPCFVIAPQCPSRSETRNDECFWVQTPYDAPSHTMKHRPPWPMRLAMELLDKTLSEKPVDAQRVYVTGLSMGAFATWDILQRKPAKFTAAIPVCGGADLACAGKLATLPLWVFHGANDETVKPERSRDIVAALVAAGGHPKYTEYPGAGHDIWGQTYSNPEVWDWLFAQVRK